MIPPGSTIGVFGSGQLGRMFAIEARKLGYRVHTYSPVSDTPTGHISDFEIAADYEDLGRVREFAGEVDVVTFEFENVPSKTIETAAEFVPVHPRGDVLHTTQNRLREKTFLDENGFPVAPFRHVTSLDELYQAIEDLGTPSVLKTAGFGYDGKGQAKIRSAEDCEPAFEGIGGKEAILEAFVDFEKEVSVVAARAQDGYFSHYGITENDHVNHILDISFSPGEVTSKLRDEAVMIARGIAEAFDYVGTLCVEFFVERNGGLLVNEIAPRPHNSGHLTFDASVTCQFEQQVRAVCGLPLGSTELIKPAAMANLLGDLWKKGEPDWTRVLEDPDVKLHLYGKAEARHGRKMGHITAMADSPHEAVRILAAARESLVLKTA
ncbi:MAG: 5-(carboxyamino)imidazole ribonucleotide synthase [Acidobacteria bacterium]|nr:MAG: 5-(carboxyamino)imidazole ribonucleotide synthase [Acidobacteriota bacterium]REJ98298.1 MAG: 5-(carboxyamino)imidazole ribonucleotide synthase [Acidobacteriota bacterium]REK17042.1 MAG: 5-(carboxyamino)imidazole ribonucleotide synthase [Acidobacteriota bacterium]REK42952.1 MAG: 5-(carboxyamino)imidazole ribonucleotide synthase [Acidobacteriota bacterium]